MRNYFLSLEELFWGKRGAGGLLKVANGSKGKDKGHDDGAFAGRYGDKVPGNFTVSFTGHDTRKRRLQCIVYTRGFYDRRPWRPPLTNKITLILSTADPLTPFTSPRVLLPVQILRSTFQNKRVEHPMRAY